MQCVIGSNPDIFCIGWLKISLLEVILISLMIVSKEWDRVGHHPDVSSPTVVVRFVPLPVLVANREDLLLHHRHVAGVEDLLVKT